MKSIHHLFGQLLTFVSRLGAALLSNRSLAICLMAVCLLLILSPWLRPPISRDFRVTQIPLLTGALTDFSPDNAAEVPRSWYLDSIAAPLLVVVVVAAVIIAIWPAVTGSAFGVLLALSITAFAVVMWNYPAIIDSFESETRDRALLRVVFRQHSEHMLSAGTSDRLAKLSDKSSRRDMLIERAHPLILPWRYSVCGAWLVGLAAAGTLVAHRGPWSRRLGATAIWAGAGIILSVAGTWPRWLAEFHMEQAHCLEVANHYAEAEKSLESAQSSMPAIAQTWRYALAKGRLSFRQAAAENRYQAFFLAHEALLNGDYDRSRDLLEPYVASNQGTSIERDLLSHIVAERAAAYASESKYSAAELSWGEAASIAPWKVSYQVAHGVAQLAAAPHLAREVEDLLTTLTPQIGDRMVASDLHTIVGDAYFVDGEFARARDMYDRAMTLFHLPKYINVQAQEGRLGL